MTDFVGKYEVSGVPLLRQTSELLERFHDWTMQNLTLLFSHVFLDSSADAGSCNAVMFNRQFCYLWVHDHSIQCSMFQRS